MDREDVSRISIDDWTSPKSTVVSTASAILHRRLAKTGAPIQRELYERHLARLIDQIFELSRSNVRVNGRNLEDVLDEEEEAETFDEGLDRKIWAMSDLRMKWQLDIANKRRGIPEAVDRLLGELLHHQREVDSRSAGVEESADEDMDDVEEAGLDDNAEATLQRLVAISQELKQSIPSQTERVENVKIVAAELEARRS